MSSPFASTSLVRLAVALALFASLPITAQPVSVTVDLDAPRQTLSGFGATIKPLVYGGADYLSPSERMAALEAAIQEVGISMGNLEMGVETGANDNADPFVANPEGFDFSFHQQTVDAVVTPGEPLGFTEWYPGSRIDQRGNHAWMRVLRTADYSNYLDEVAENVEQQMIWWRDTYGEVPDIIQLFNEPTTGNFELRGGSAMEVVDIIKRAGARLRAAGFTDVLFVVPNQEKVTSSTSTAQLIYNDAEARQYVGAIGYHPYPYGSAYASPSNVLAQSGSGTPNATAVADRQALDALRDDFEAALGRPVPLWMTEVSEGPGNNDFPYGDVHELRARAIHIHDEVAYAGASAYYGMHLLWDQRSHSEHFGGSCDYRSEESSIVLIDNMDCNGDGDTGEITINPIGYAIGHYARWAPPGSVVVGTTSEDPLVQVTGFHDEAGDRLALVLINNRPDAVTVEVALSGGLVGDGVTGEASYADVRWGPAPAVDAGSDRLSLTLPPASVVSLGIPLGTATSESSSAAPPMPSLRAPFPNPTPGAATIPSVIERSGPVRLEVVDVLGRVVAVLADGVRAAGSYADRLPDGLPSGRYTLRLQTSGGIDTIPLTVAR